MYGLLLKAGPGINTGLLRRPKVFRNKRREQLTMGTEKKNTRVNKTAQATIEFAFAFIVVVLVFYGCVKVMQWLGLGLGTPVENHRAGLHGQCQGASPSCEASSQLDESNFPSMSMPRLRAVFNGQLINP